MRSASVRNRYAPDNRADPAQHAHEMRELLSRPVGAQDQIPTEQVRLVGLLLELVGVPSEPHANLGAVRIARRSNAGHRLHIRPRAQLREHVLESVERVFHARFSGEAASGNVSDPLGIQRVHGQDNLVVQMLDFTQSCYYPTWGVVVISATILRFPVGSESILACSVASGAAAGFLTDALTRYGFRVTARLGIGLAHRFSVHRFSQIFILFIESYSQNAPVVKRCNLQTECN